VILKYNSIILNELYYFTSFEFEFVILYFVLFLFDQFNAFNIIKNFISIMILKIKYSKFIPKVIKHIYVRLTYYIKSIIIIITQLYTIVIVFVFISIFNHIELKKKI
jgi:hypothetical protein